MYFVNIRIVYLEVYSYLQNLLNYNSVERLNYDKKKGLAANCGRDKIKDTQAVIIVIQIIAIVIYKN